MKKSLLALAAMGAFASAAQAQSSVTVYGVLDEGYVGGNLRQSNGTVATSGAAPTTTTANEGKTGVIKKTGGGFAAGGESTNRIGVRGSEDLGGGMSAFFTYEAKIDIDSGSGSGSGGGAGDSGLFSTTRQAFVGLKKNGIGSFALGTQNTVIYDAVLATDPTGTNNMAGSLLSMRTTSSVSSAYSAGYQTGLSGDSAYATRQRNMLTLKSDNFAGFTARALVLAAAANSTSTLSSSASVTGVGGTSNSTGYGLGLDYTWNKLYLTANMQSFKNSVSALAQSTPPVIFGATTAGAAGSTNNLGSNVQDNGQYYAATYDFGILKAYANYVNRKMSMDSNTSYFSKFTAQQFGVRSFITPTVEGWIAGSVGKYSSLPQIVTTGGGATYTPGQANLTAMQVGANYYLSKRTNLYAIYGQQGSSNVAFAAAGATTPGNTTSANVNNYAVGVRHTF
jgi:predicted porin